MLRLTGCSLLLCALLSAVRSDAAIAITGVTDKTKYAAAVTVLVTADPNAATTTATLDGAPMAVGVSLPVAAVSYHEVKAESRDAGGALVDSKLTRFIVTNPARGDTEDGIPSHTPFKTVNDARSAFAGLTLKVVAPAAWPAGLPVPLAAVLRGANGEGVRLNGVVHFSAFPQNPLQLRRGWGSIVGAAPAAAGILPIGAYLNGLTDSSQISVESSAVYTDVSGTIASNTVWPPNARIRVTSTLTIAAGATLTVSAGSIVLLDTGTSTNGSAAEIVVNGTLQVNGAEGAPAVFAPATAGGNWGGIELPAVTSKVIASHAIFTGSGEDEVWFNGKSYSTHKPQQALFLVAGSGTGTAVGAELHLTDCFCFSLAGQEMNSKTNTWIDLSRTLLQRAVTCGELNGSKVTIDRSALIEFPSEDSTFIDGDNDAIYFTNGDLSVTNSVIGFTKDDGIDSGGNGGDNPFTAAADVTPFLSQNNWYEGTYHEGNSLSGTRNVTFAGCVFLNCGQGVEDGYSSSGTSDGPNAVVDGCLFVSNMVGARWGDNYGSGYNYNGSMEVKNSILLNNLYKDAFSGQWHPTQANAWIYQTTATNTFGRAYFNVHDSYLSQPDPVHHPVNTTWKPAAHATLLAPFMPVPGSDVGVAISSYDPAQGDPAAYPGTFTARLSSFSSRPVSVDWAVLGKVDPSSATSTTVAGGTLQFAPGETLKTILVPMAPPVNYGFIHVALTNAVNAEVTGEAFYIKPPAGAAPFSYIPAASGGWRYREARSEPPADWKTLNFDDSSAAATEWLPATLPAGFPSGSVTTVVNGGSSTDRTKAFYFRKKFTVDDPAKIKGLTIRLRRDDAAVAWLNANATPVAVSADGAFAGPYTYAMTGVPNATTTTFVDYSVDPAMLVTGTNILAVELHQTSLTSGDIFLDCELNATPQPPFVLNVGWSGQQALLWWFDPAALLEQSLDLHNWFPARTTGSPQPVDPAGVKEFFRLRR